MIFPPMTKSPPSQHEKGANRGFFACILGAGIIIPARCNWETREDNRVEGSLPIFFAAREAALGPSLHLPQRSIMPAIDAIAVTAAIMPLIALTAYATHPGGFGWDSLKSSTMRPFGNRDRQPRRGCERYHPRRSDRSGREGGHGSRQRHRDGHLRRHCKQQRRLHRRLVGGPLPRPWNCCAGGALGL
jgi:hypothetical protein